MTGINLTIGPRASFVDNLAARLPRMTERIRSERIVTEAINDGLQYRRVRKYMGLADKMKHLAERAKAVPATLEAVADQHLERLAALETRGTESFARLGQVLDATEGGIVAAEDALNQLTNGGDPL